MSETRYHPRYVRHECPRYAMRPDTPQIRHVRPRLLDRYEIRPRYAMYALDTRYAPDTPFTRIWGPDTPRYALSSNPSAFGSSSKEAPATVWWWRGLHCRRPESSVASARILDEWRASWWLHIVVAGVILINRPEPPHEWAARRRGSEHPRETAAGRPFTDHHRRRSRCREAMMI